MANALKTDWFRGVDMIVLNVLLLPSRAQTYDKGARRRLHTAAQLIQRKQHQLLSL
jgi:hypothetical protein